MIQVDNLTRTYGNFTAVDDVSFTIAPGEIVGLLGHNGAGKTTIMKMLTGYLEPTAGAITIDGLDLAENRRLIQQKIGYLPENCPVYPEMTVIDYLDYAAALHSVSDHDRPKLIAQVLARTALQEKAMQPIATLSRGYRQRTGVAQAILHDPSILVLDEPTNGLDPTQIQHMRNLIADLASTATVIISTHILQEVQAVCDRVIIMKDGHKALDCRLDELQVGNRLLVHADGAKMQTQAIMTDCHGVNSATEITPAGQAGGFTFALTLEQGADRQQTAAAVAGAVHDQGGKLYGMQFETRNLETVFAEIGAQ